MEQKPTICLNMIVKNEAHIIEETLNSIYKYVDYYVINDTGSTDGTQNKIKDFFDNKNIKGEIINHEFRSCECHDQQYKIYDWFHFGWNRSYALQKCIGKSDFILIFDADDLLIGSLPINELNLNQNCYDLKIGNNFVYYRPQILKNDGGFEWKYIGGLHEYLDSEIPKKSVKLDGDYYIESRRLGNRNQVENKYKRDANIFEELLKEEPENERYLFYCAQSYKDCGELENAIKYYEKHVKMGGYIEETYYSLYTIAKCKQSLKYSQTDVINSYLTAFIHYSKRVEPLYEIIHYFRLMNKFYDGYTYAKKALQSVIIYPQDDILFVQKDIYDYKLYDEIALCAYYTGKFRHAHELWNKILNEKKYPSVEHNRIMTNLDFAKRNIKDKPILCFYVGYTPDYTRSATGVYGSELALKHLSELFTRYYDVYIFGTSFKSDSINDVNFRNSSELSIFSIKNEIDVMIISRYIHYFVEYNINAKKTFLWLHDLVFQPFWNGKELPYGGKILIENMMNKIDGVITLSDWHKQNVLKFINIPNDKIFIIGNAIDITLFSKNIEKVKNRFIWTSNPTRGLDKLIEYFHEIKKHIIDAELYIYRGIEEFDENLVREIERYDYIKFMGKYDNYMLVKEMEKAEYWFYPTNFHETYCISALEAQMAKCVCITSKIGALQNTIENRGILIEDEIYSNKYWNNALDKIIMLNDNNDIKNDYINKGYDWAKNQTWKNRLDEWLAVINKIYK